MIVAVSWLIAKSLSLITYSLQLIKN